MSPPDRLPKAMFLGEALVDLVVAADGAISASVGGAPFNAARAAARLGAPVGFAGAVSTDGFGEQIVAALAAADVDPGAVAVTDAPTTLAVAQLDQHGVASYRFYTAGTSVPGYVPPVDLADVALLVTGGLALALEPLAGRVVEIVERADFSILDVNCRPLAVDDWARYRTVVDRAVAASAVVKVSDEDLDALWPGRPLAECVAELLAAGPQAVIVTRGALPIRVHSPHFDAFEVPVPAVDVVDTIGAGDAFVGALVVGLLERAAGRADLGSVPISASEWAEVAAMAAQVAAIACTRRGADPPRRADLPVPWRTPEDRSDR